MKKLIILAVFSIFCIRTNAQSSVTIVPNPTASGTVSSLRIDSQGKLISTAGITNYYNLSNLDLMPNSAFNASMNKFTRDDFTYGTCYFNNTATDNDWMLAPVDLPDGSVITRLRTYYIDESTGVNGQNLTIKLMRRPKATNGNPLSELVIATNVTTTPTTHHNAMDIEIASAAVSTNNVIDNLTYHYFIKIIVSEFDVDVNINWVGNILAVRNVELQYTF